MKPDLDKYKSFLFDLDGTILNTNGIYADAAAAFIKSKNKQPRHDIQFERYEFITNYKGNNCYVDLDQYLIDSYKLDATLNEFRKFNSAYVQNIFRKVDYQPGASELLLELRSRNLPMCLVTATDKKTLDICKYENETIKAKANLDYIFGNNVITGDMIQRHKPNPEAYLKALQLLGLKPKECLVFEDVLLGVMAAKTAGVDVCIVYNEDTVKNTERMCQLTPYRINTLGELLNKRK